MFYIFTTEFRINSFDFVGITGNALEFTSGASTYVSDTPLAFDTFAANCSSI